MRIRQSLDRFRQSVFTPFMWSEQGQHGPMHPSIGRTVLPHIGLAEVFVDYERHDQAAHMGRHFFLITSKYGHAVCSTCEVRAWSASFVASGAFPIVTQSVNGKVHVIADTSTYIADTLARYRISIGVQS